MTCHIATGGDCWPPCSCYPATRPSARGLGFRDYRDLCALVDSGTHGHPGGIGWTDAAKIAAAGLARNGLRLSVRLDGSPRIVAETA